MRKFAASLLTTLALSQALLALPEGEWRNEFQGTPVTITVSSAEVQVRLGEGTETVGFKGPVADVKEPADGQPGRIVIGPTEGDDESFEVLWFQNADGDWARFGIDPNGYQTPVDAEGATLEGGDESLDGFMAAEYYQKVDSLPVMPALKKDELIAFFKEVQARDKGDARQAVTLILIEKGYHPVDSEEGLAQAIEANASDPEVKALLEKLGLVVE